MIELTLADVLRATDAIWSFGRTADVPLSDVSTDTRTLRPGSLFLGIPGPRFDGVEFADAAILAGATCVLAADGPGVRERLEALSRDHGVPVATCASATAALGAIGSFVRDRLDARVIAVTGSCGKTSTKETLDTLLSASRATVVSPASFNNEIGVPRTLLLADERTETLVLEVGSNAPGEIATLAAIARPDVTVITNIGRAHLAGLGSLEGVAREKGALIDVLDPARAKRPAVVLNRDCKHTPLLLDRVQEGVRVFTTSAAGDPSASLFARDVTLVRDGTEFVIDGPALPAHLRGMLLSVPLLGEQAAANVLSALAAVLASGADIDAALAAIGALAPAPHRLEPHSAGGVLVIDDAYNANPDSMAAAIGVLARIELPGAGGCDGVDAAGARRVLAVGEMAELGVATLQLHREAGERARNLGIDVVIAVGDCAPRTPLSAFLEGARGPRLEAAGGAGLEGAHGAGLEGAHGAGALTLHADSIEQAAEILLDGPQRLVDGDAIVVKASRAVGLERLAAHIVKALEANGRTPELVHGGGVTS